MLKGFPLEDITIYCRYLDKEKEEQYTVVHLFGVAFDKSKSTTTKTTGVVEKGEVVFYIPKDVKCTLPYAKPKAFQENPLSTYTLKAGDKVIIGYVGNEQELPTEVTFTLDNTLNDVSKIEGCKKSLEKLYDDVYTITDIADYNFGSLSHFEVRCV